MGKHSKPSLTKKRVAGAAMAGAGIGVGVTGMGLGTADAFPGQAALVNCESGGNPHAVNNTAAGIAAGRPAGLFQIVTGTWRAYGGAAFAPTADLATPAQQQIVADRIYAAQGSAPWVCHTGSGPAAFANFGGVGSATPTIPQKIVPPKVIVPQKIVPPKVIVPQKIVPPVVPHVVPQHLAPSIDIAPAADTVTPAPAPDTAKHSEAHGRYHVVQAGESLWRIASANYGHGTSWKEIYAANRSVVGNNPDLIQPGQQILLP